MNTMGIAPVSCLRAATEESSVPNEDVGLLRHELLREGLCLGGVVIAPAEINLKIAILDPAEYFEFRAELVNNASCSALGLTPSSIPTRRRCCCPRTTSGHPTAAPTTTAMNSRRLSGIHPRRKRGDDSLHPKPPH